MERIAVFSDTHGNVERMVKALNQIGQADRVFHLGDNIRDAIRLSDQIKIPVTSVIGNCDFGSAGPAEETVRICGRKLLLLHGHKYGVKYGLDRLSYYAEECKADAVFFGHTHAASIGFYGKILMMNPGSLREPAGGGYTFGVVTVSEKAILPKTVELETF